MSKKKAAIAPPRLVSDTMISNIYTMGACEHIDVRQTIGNLYTVPNANIRILRARLLLEECLETIEAMGIRVIATETGELSMAYPPNVEMRTDTSVGNEQVDIIKVIDGCVDLNYVSTGTLLAFGVPDTSHQEIVNIANMNKFPNGTATLDANGKYQKPNGWVDPNKAHGDVIDSILRKYPTNLLFRRGGSWAEGLRRNSSDLPNVMKYFRAGECTGRKRLKKEVMKNAGNKKKKTNNISSKS